MASVLLVASLLLASFAPLGADQFDFAKVNVGGSAHSSGGEPAYRHRAALLGRKVHARAEGKTGMKQDMKKVFITGKKQRAQGISLHSIPEWGEDHQASSVIQDELRSALRESRPSLLVDARPDAFWPPPPRSTVAPANDRGYHRETFDLPSGWPGEERRKQRKDDTSKKARAPIQGGRLPGPVRATPLNKVHRVAGGHSPNAQLQLESAPTMQEAIRRLHTVRRTAPPKQIRQRNGKNGQRKFYDPLIHKKVRRVHTTTPTPTSTTTEIEEEPEWRIPPSSPITSPDSPEFVESLGSAIEEEERKVIRTRKTRRNKNYGVNPLMYRVVDGVLYDKTGTAVRRVSGVPNLNGETVVSRKRLRLRGPARAVAPPLKMDTEPEISHDEDSFFPDIFSIKGLGRTRTTPFSPVTMPLTTPPPPSPPSVLSSPPAPLTPPPPLPFSGSVNLFAPLPIPALAHISFPQSQPTPGAFPSTASIFRDPPPTSTSPPLLSAYPVSPLPFSAGNIHNSPPFPFVNCYMNIDGFMCCNRTLEAVMREVAEGLQCKGECGMQTIVEEVRKTAEARFSTDFEVVAASGDFAAHAHFSADLTCKIEKGGKYIAAYATATAKTIKSDDPQMKIVNGHLMETRDPIFEDVDAGITTEPLTTGEEDLVIFSTRATEVPPIVDEFSEFQFDAPSLSISKPDEDPKMIIPLHERSRGKSEFALSWIK